MPVIFFDIFTIFADDLCHVERCSDAASLRRIGLLVARYATPLPSARFQSFRRWRQRKNTARAAYDAADVRYFSGRYYDAAHLMPFSHHYMEAPSLGARRRYPEV